MHKDGFFRVDAVDYPISASALFPPHALPRDVKPVIQLLMGVAHGIAVAAKRSPGRLKASPRVECSADGLSWSRTFTDEETKAILTGDAP